MNQTGKTPPVSRPPNPGWSTLGWAALTSMALCAGSAGLVDASDSPTAQGNVILTGGTDGYYNGGEWPEVARTVLSVALCIRFRCPRAMAIVLPN